MTENPLQAIDARTLMGTNFPEPVYVVEGLISQGVTFLCGPSKIGKSWLVLWLGLCVAEGKPVWEDYPTHGWTSYLDMKNTPIFADVKDFPKDPFFYDIAYYAAFLSYQEKNYADAEKYAHLAAESPEKVDDANEILLFSKKDNCKTHEDSLAYVDYVKELHKNNPESERYFNLLMDYYTRANDQAALKAWAEEEIALNANNKMAWALKGEVQMNNNEWDAAVESYQKAIDIDPEFVQCVFNAGVCLNSKAIAMNDQLADKKTGGLTTENANKVKAVLADAQKYLERAKDLDGDQLKVKWAYPLYRIYYSLNLSDKMAELEAIDPTLKQ